MNSLRNVVFLKMSPVVMSPRLLSGSVDKCDSKNETAKGDESKKKKKTKKDLCGNEVLPTAPRCKTKPGEGKSK